MPYVIQIVGDAHAEPCALSGKWLAEYDPERMRGFGWIQGTPLRDRALRFADLDAALACYRRSPAARPLREDGQPNRPLAAYTVSIERVER